MHSTFGYFGNSHDADDVDDLMSILDPATMVLIGGELCILEC